MSDRGLCFNCGRETGIYNGKTELWECPLCVNMPHDEDKLLPAKFKKRLKTGRWARIRKTDGEGRWVAVGILRKSTGEEWFI